MRHLESNELLRDIFDLGPIPSTPEKVNKFARVSPYFLSAAVSFFFRWPIMTQQPSTVIKYAESNGTSVPSSTDPPPNVNCFLPVFLL